MEEGLKKETRCIMHMYLLAKGVVKLKHCKRVLMEI